MSDKLERLIKLVYKKWKSGQLEAQEAHPEDEELVCFLEDRLSEEEREGIKTHLMICDACMEAFAIQLKLRPAEEKEVPQELLARIKNLIVPQEYATVLEVLLRVKEKMLEILNTTGDVLVGSELVPAPVLRSRKIKDFKDEITILKDFKDIRAELKIENKLGEAFDLSVTIKEKETQKVIKDLRVTLLRDDLELESYLTSSGKVTFEHVLLGKYTVAISDTENKLAHILIDIKT